MRVPNSTPLWTSTFLPVVPINHGTTLKVDNIWSKDDGANPAELLAMLPEADRVDLMKQVANKTLTMDEVRCSGLNRISHSRVLFNKFHAFALLEALSCV
jgi:hypothetical protein